MKRKVRKVERAIAGRILEDRRASKGCWEKVGLAGVVGGG